MGTKRIPRNLSPAPNTISSSQPGFLRRPVTAPQSAMVYPNQLYDIRMRGQYGPGNVHPAYANAPPYTSTQANMQYAYYGNVENPAQYNESTIHEEVDEEELDEQVLDREESDLANRTEETNRLTVQDQVNANTSAEYDKSGVETGNAPERKDMRERYDNFIDPRGRAPNPNSYLQPRKNPYPFQNVNPNKSTNGVVLDKHFFEAWVKYQESLKKSRIPRSPTGKEFTASERGKIRAGGEGTLTADGMEHVLGEMEYNEMIKIKKDLIDFQKARRRLIYDATSIKPLFNYQTKS